MNINDLKLYVIQLTLIRFCKKGADKTAAVFNKDDEQVVAILKGHSKKVNRVIYHPSGENIVVTASYDATIRIWDVPTSQVTIILFGTNRLKNVFLLNIGESLKHVNLRF